MNYCTLFNSYYLSRGLALYYSLANAAKSFHLYIFAFDQEVYEILTKMSLKHVTIISLSEFETPDLLEVKPLRSVGEYCWTCTPAVIFHCLDKLHLKEACYLDADLFFWRDPSVLLEEVADASILITEHRYTKEYDHAEISGKYCVQFMYFKNSVEGLKALTWWRSACIEWCYNRVEPGKFGDQKYLDDWTERFSAVKVLSHLGGGVAPWNVQQYELMKSPLETPPILREKATGNLFDLIFYHFHGVHFINDKIDLGGYKLSSGIIKTLYYEYIKKLKKVEQELKENQDLALLINTINLHGQVIKKYTFINLLKNLKKKFLGNNNVLLMREI